MSERRIKIGVRMGLPIVLEMLTTIGLRNAIGGECKWLMAKERRDKMKPWQAEKLNEAMWNIAEELAYSHITYSEDRQAVIDQVKRVLKPVKTNYVYERCMKHDTRWWTYRTRALHGNGYGYCFTEQEVLQINLAIKEISSRLLSIELESDDATTSVE